MGVDNDVVLATRLAPSGEGPVASPPFRARRWEPSTEARDRSKASPARSSASRSSVQLLPHAALLPAAQPTPAGHPRAEAQLLRQELPPDPGLQHEQDPAHGPALVKPLASGIAVAPLHYREQRFNPLPQPVLDFPRSALHHPRSRRTRPHPGREVHDHLPDRAAGPVGDLKPWLSPSTATPWARCETPPCRSASLSRDGGRSPHEEAAFTPALPAAPGERLLIVLGGVRALQCGADGLADLRELAYLLRCQRVEDGAAYGLDMAGGRTLQELAPLWGEQSELVASVGGVVAAVHVTGLLEAGHGVGEAGCG